MVIGLGVVAVMLSMWLCSYHCYAAATIVIMWVMWLRYHYHFAVIVL